MELKISNLQSDREKGKYSKIATRKKLTYEDTSLNKNKTYYYKVRAYYVKDGKTFMEVIQK